MQNNKEKLLHKFRKDMIHAKYFIFIFSVLMILCLIITFVFETRVVILMIFLFLFSAYKSFEWYCYYEDFIRILEAT